MTTTYRIVGIIADVYKHNMETGEEEGHLHCKDVHFLDHEAPTIADLDAYLGRFELPPLKDWCNEYAEGNRDEDDGWYTYEIYEDKYGSPSQEEQEYSVRYNISLEKLERTPVNLLEIDK